MSTTLSVLQLQLILITLVLVPTVVGQNTQLTIFAQNSSPTLPQAAPIGSTIVFACAIPALTAYTGAFSYTELHAQVAGLDTLICASTQSGTCTANSQTFPFTTRTISVYVSSTIGTTFSLSNAAVSDSLNYYCRISAGNVLYSQIAGTWSSLIVYSIPLTPSCSFVGSTNVFVSGNLLPQISCSGNVGAPSGWFSVSATNVNGMPTAYSSNFNLISNTSTLLQNGTYSISYLYGYLNNGATSYTLSQSNNGDTITVYAYNSYVFTYLGGIYSASSSLNIQVQYPVSGISITTSSSLASSLSGSGGSYTMTVAQGTSLVLTCNAQGNPTPTYVWSKVGGQNSVLFISAQVSGTLNFPETLTLQCSASNTLTTAQSATMITATVVITVTATTTSTTTATTMLAVASIGGGAIAGIVIGCLIALALIIALIIWCVCCPPGKKQPVKTEQPLQSAAAPMSQAGARSMMFEPEDKKLPLSMVSEMDIPYGDGAFEDTPRSRKPIVDPHAQSAAEYLDLRNGMNGSANGASQPTTPNGNFNSVPPTYPGGTLPRGTAYGTLANPYGTMNGYGVNGDGGYNTGTMA